MSLGNKWDRWVDTHETEILVAIVFFYFVLAPLAIASWVLLTSLG